MLDSGFQAAYTKNKTSADSSLDDGITSDAARVCVV